MNLQNNEHKQQVEIGSDVSKGCLEHLRGKVCITSECTIVGITRPSCRWISSAKLSTMLKCVTPSAAISRDPFSISQPVRLNLSHAVVHAGGAAASVAVVKLACW